MNVDLINKCKSLNPDDTIVHVGDLYCYSQQIKPFNLIQDIPASFINIRGNHDLNNKVKSICESLHFYLNKRFPYISASHYPTYDAKISRDCLTAPIHLCGHVHSRWKHCLDLDHNILNINVGVDAWNYRLVSEEELIVYLNKLFRMSPNELVRCKKNKYGNLKFFFA
jgi:calcineurin-like phosphoesterase family protein